jgi:hypothetical protein
MDMRNGLLRIAAVRPHILIIGGLGTDRLRARVEREVDRRHWIGATAPADTDVLVVAGQPGPELTAVVDDVWATVPAPRARVDIRNEHEVTQALDDAVTVLQDLSAQRAGAPRDGLRSERPSPSDTHDEHSEHSEHSSHGHDSGHDSGHEDHDGGHHHGGGMELPGGLVMADLGQDRDGLTLDRLHVALGPVLPEWPAALVVEVVLQGDVIQEARSRFLDADDVRTVDSLPPAAQGLEAVARVLALTGWAGPAGRARRLRDAVLDDGADTTRTLEEVDALRRRVRRSPVLRWMLRSTGPGRWDVHEKIDTRLRAVRADVTGTVADTTTDRVDLSTLDARLVGAELAAARLIVAAADPHPRFVSARAVSAEDVS